LDPAAAEKRLTESVNRLLRAECLVRADLSRIKQAEHAQYQLTSLGKAVAEWHVENTLGIKRKPSCRDESRFGLRPSRAQLEGTRG